MTYVLLDDEGNVVRRLSYPTEFTVEVSISDNLYAGSGSGAERMVEAVIHESTAILGESIVNQILHAAVSDGLRMSVGLVFQGEQYEGWVVNANTFASSRILGMNANSFCQYQNEYFACANGGIYSMNGADDAGSPIEAFISTGNVKPFGQSMSRVFDAYLLMKNDGPMKIRIIVQDTPDTYEIHDFNASFINHRVKLSKGLKSVAWRFEISNMEGSDFDLDTFKIYPIELTRHI